MPSLWVVFLKLGNIDHADVVTVRRAGCGKEGWGMYWGELTAISKEEQARKLLPGERKCMPWDKRQGRGNTYQERRLEQGTLGVETMITDQS